MQGFPPHLPGSIVMRGWVVADIPEVYLGADRLVMPIYRQTATTTETSRRLPDDVQIRPPDPRVGAAPDLVVTGPLEFHRVGV